MQTMKRPRRLPAIETAIVLVLGLSASASAAEDGSTARDAAPPPDQSASAGSDAPSELRAAIEGAIGASVHGTLTGQYRWRSSANGTDQDAYQLLDLRVGDASKDRISANLFVRAAEDLDRAHSGDHAFDFRSIDDKYDKTVDTWLYSAYATIRPDKGAFIETVRLGRQYVYAAETFHVDGASATTRPLADALALRLTAYAGIPVHFYESSRGGDWLAGLRAEADPWSGGRAAVDYAHVKDRLSLIGAQERNDFAAFSMWQEVAQNVDVHGQFQWLDQPRDATLRVTAAVPESDFLVQASYYRLLENERQLATEFDPYSNVIQEFVRYETAAVHATLGLAEHVDVEVGASTRRLLSGENETRFNRDVNRYYVTPSVSDLPWEGSTISVTGESYSGGGERLRTWGIDVAHRFDSRLRVSAGSDYTLYGFGPLATEERAHVRTVYLRARFPVTGELSADVRYTWERDDVETYQVLTLALVLDF